VAPCERVREWIERVNDARGAILGGPTTLIASECHGAESTTVVAAIARDHLVASGVDSSDAERDLVGLCARAREQEGVDVARHDRGQQRAQLGSHGRRADARVRVADLVHLLDHGVDHRLRRRVSKVRAHGLRVEVEVALAVHVEEVHALAVGDGDRGIVHRCGGTPREQRMLGRLLLDLGRGPERVIGHTGESGSASLRLRAHTRRTSAAAGGARTRLGRTARTVDLIHLGTSLRGRAAARGGEVGGRQTTRGHEHDAARSNDAVQQHRRGGDDERNEAAAKHDAIELSLRRSWKSKNARHRAMSLRLSLVL